MYVVVGCPACRELWIREAGGERTSCPACGRSHAVKRLQPLYESDDVDATRDARTRLLAERAGQTDVADFSDLSEAAERPTISDEAHLSAFGIDPATVEAAGTDDGPNRRDQRQIVTDAIANADSATEEQIVEASGEAGVDTDSARAVLDRLRRDGHVTESNGTYRLL